MLQTYDTHAHIDHLENLDQALSDAQSAGVKGIVAMSMDLESCRKNLQIKAEHQDIPIYLAMGTHPSEAKLDVLDESLKFIRENAGSLHAIGEIGLDFWYKWVRKDQQKKDEQRKVFKEHLLLAKDLDLPVVVHARGVWRECLDTVVEVGLKKAEFHWYSGPVDVLKDIVAKGFFVSTTPSCAYSQPVIECIESAPIENTLIETDCPVTFRNKITGEEFQAEPKDVFRTLDAYCLLKNIEKQEAVNQLNKNAENFFNIN